MASRFSHSTLHQRDSRSALFEGYSGSGRNSADPTRRPSPALGGYGYGYPGSNGTTTSHGTHLSVESRGSYRPATPNSKYDSLLPCLPQQPSQARRWFSFYEEGTNHTGALRGQYSDAVLNELESQNDQQVEGILGKVKVLKDMTVAIGDEIRESSALAEKMNDTFDSTRLRLRGTMNRMLVMAERTGVGWKVWLGFFAAVVLIFVYVWLF
ncbi:protein transport protein bet1 [Parahypoxylon ruwenzoriense]